MCRVDQWSKLVFQLNAENSNPILKGIYFTCCLKEILKMEEFCADLMNIFAFICSWNLGSSFGDSVVWRAIILDLDFRNTGFWYKINAQNSIKAPNMKFFHIQFCFKRLEREFKSNLCTFSIINAVEIQGRRNMQEGFGYCKHIQ